MPQIFNIEAFYLVIALIVQLNMDGYSLEKYQS